MVGYSILVGAFCLLSCLFVAKEAIEPLLWGAFMFIGGVPLVYCSHMDKFQKLTTAQCEDVTMWRNESRRVIAYMAQVNTQKRELVYSEYVTLKRMAEEDRAEQVKKSLYSN